MKEVGKMKRISLCYTNGGEHLSDELIKLDALLHLQILRFRHLHSRTQGDDDAFAGLYIREEEVDSVIGKHLQDRSEPGTAALIKQVQTLQESISIRIEKSLENGVYLPLYQLARLFYLTPFQLDILLICLAPELDVKYEKLYAYLQDDVTKKSPSVNLILDVLCRSRAERTRARTFFFDPSPLVKYDLIKCIDDSQSRPLISRCLKLDDRIVNFLLEQDVLDSEVASLAKVLTPTRDWSSLLMEKPANEGLARLAENFFNKEEQENLVFYLKGPYGAGKKATAEAFCNQLGVPMIIGDMIELLNIDSQMKVEDVVKRLFREALLRPAVIYLEHFDQLMSDNAREIHIQNAIARAMEEFSFITFLAGEKSWAPAPRLKKHPVIKVELPIPSFQLRKRLWEMSLNDGCPLSEAVDFDEIANKFQFTGGQIRDAAAEAKRGAVMYGTLHKEGVTMADLYCGAHAQSNQNLSKMARKITPHYTWSDIVLPPDKLRQLKEMCNYVKYRHLVYGEWGFDKKVSLGKGLNILFSGPSGTGKTMASEIIANELSLDFYKIDLSCVVSKYIGETEKNLSGIFKEAEAANAVLFFDEADALFGKRSEVKDAHDRYANIEINYLLQKMEEHKGIVILATNFRKNIDEAFTRRMHFLLDFPFPDEEYRLDIWRKVFPAETPRSLDVDYEFLARKFIISGGSIKNIALNAAFLAADEDDMFSVEDQKKGSQQETGNSIRGRPRRGLAADNSRKVDMRHIIHAVKREYRKMGKLCTQSDFGKYYSMIVREVGKGETARDGGHYE